MNIREVAEWAMAAPCRSRQLATHQGSKSPTYMSPHVRTVPQTVLNLSDELRFILLKLCEFPLWNKTSPPVHCLYHATQRAAEAGSDVNGRSEGAYHRSKVCGWTMWLGSCIEWNEKNGKRISLPPTRPLTEEKAVEKILSTLSGNQIDQTKC